MPSTFATPDDLAARLGLDLDDGEQARATLLLADATGLIQDEARQNIFLVENDTLTIRGTTDERVKLPERPVVSIASVTVAGRQLAQEQDWVRDGNELVRIPINTVFAVIGRLDQVVYPYTPGFGWEGQILEIVYTHGYADDDLPGFCKSICLEAVVRVWVNPGSVARETIGDTSTVYDNMRFAPTGLLLNDDERRTIRRFFGRRSRSITIGG
jgi:hypothetical protein